MKKHCPSSHLFWETCSNQTWMCVIVTNLPYQGPRSCLIATYLFNRGMTTTLASCPAWIRCSWLKAAAATTRGITALKVRIRLQSMVTKLVFHRLTASSIRRQLVEVIWPFSHVDLELMRQIKNSNNWRTKETTSTIHNTLAISFIKSIKWKLVTSTSSQVISTWLKTT